MTVDYIIVGQGICGTFLSYYLQQSGKRVLVIDEDRPFTASKVASGVINPVTGRRIVRTWMIEEVMPFAVNAYKELGEKIDADLIRQSNILDFHPTPQMMLAFKERMPQEQEYLRLPDNPTKWNEYFNYPFGIGEINPVWLMDLHALLKGWRNRLKETNSLLEDKFDQSQLVITTQSEVHYKEITAEKIIFCDGVAGIDNPYFRLLPYSQNKGEVIIAEIDGLPQSNIYKQGYNIVPWKDNLFWIGSTYEWSFSDPNPTEIFRKKVEIQLNTWLKLPYKIVDHIASIRPANLERRPFVGFHPIHTNIGLFNGMGTKGCSLAPYFGHQFAAHLAEDKPLLPDVDVRRFSKILSKA